MVAAADAGRTRPASSCDLAAGDVDLFIRSGAGAIAADTCGAGSAGGPHSAAEDGNVAAGRRTTIISTADARAGIAAHGIERAVAAVGGDGHCRPRGDSQAGFIGAALQRHRPGEHQLHGSAAGDGKGAGAGDGVDIDHHLGAHGDLVLAAGDGDGLVHIGGIGLDDGIIPGIGGLGSAVLGIARGGDDDAALGQVQGHGLFLRRVDLHRGEGEEKCETQKQGKRFCHEIPSNFSFFAQAGSPACKRT